MTKQILQVLRVLFKVDHIFFLKQNLSFSSPLFLGGGVFKFSFFFLRNTEALGMRFILGSEQIYFEKNHFI